MGRFRFPVVAHSSVPVATTADSVVVDWRIHDCRSELGKSRTSEGGLVVNDGGTEDEGRVGFDVRKEEMDGHFGSQGSMVLVCEA